MTTAAVLTMGRAKRTTARGIADALATLRTRSIPLGPGGRMTTVTYSYARLHLAELWDTIENEQQPVLVQRRGHEDMALLPATELASLQETVHLLRSPRNAARLHAALARAEAVGAR